MTTASAPGKVILFGEHAVVSGIPALGSAIDLRARVTIEDLPGSLEVKISNLALKGFSLDLVTGRISSPEAMNAARYVSAVLSEFQAHDLRVKVTSDIPPAAGLGSSAAIVVATIAALNEKMGLGLTISELASYAHRIEKTVQQGLGSPMDTALSTFGGYLRVSKEIQKIDLPQMDLVVGYTNMEHDTQSEVQKVQRLRSKYPDIVDPVFQAMEAISAISIPLIKERRLEDLGQLMNINHGLLEAVGVGTRELSELVYAARGAGGALGAKLTGAGGGGCIIALPSDTGSSTIITAINQAKGTSFHVLTGGDGVRLETQR
jgi:mevalonate kinase